MGKRKREARLDAQPGVERLRAGAELEVTVERILPGGLGLAHAEGQTLLVALSAPGDRALVRVERLSGGTAFASIKRILEPSIARVEPLCPYFGRCGGCDFQQLSYEAQLAAKVEIVRDCLRRVARVEPPAEIHHGLLEPLVREALSDAGGQSALDLFCGVGLFTLPLARRFSRVVGVEGNAAACAFARRNLQAAGLSNARVETSGVGEWMRRRSQAHAPFDFALLDPPRAGAEPETVAAFLTLRPSRISYVSCDPATLARDLRALIAGGYRLSSVRAFDMFPQTHHVETVAHITF
ncbi:MAG: methyltransferase domain-containing protein [Acidobacteria bacterium]|nr:methyltransferase domain-containing protein [Acidobacteriota bacterium]